MIYAECVLPDERIYKDFKAIMDMGKTADVDAGLSERLHALRRFIKRWEKQVSDNLIRPVRNMIADAEFTHGTMPQLPKKDSYDVKDPKGFDELWTAVEQKWHELIHYLEKNKGNPAQISDQSIDKFVQLTGKLSNMCETYKPKAVKIVECGKGYTLTSREDWPGRLVTIVEDETDIQYFTNLAAETKNALLNTSKFVVWNTLEELQAGKSVLRERFVPTVALKKDDEEELELEETENTIVYAGTLVTAKMYNGVKAPIPTNIDGTYTKTMLGRLRREQLYALANMFERKDPISEYADRPFLIGVILEEQVKSKNKRIFLR